MDIDQLKTFLEVNRTRHFGRAGKNLFITQSAVSARIRLLEETLGVRLFKRNRNDLQLTAAGERMIKHAETILNVWYQARQDTALDESHSVFLSIGGMHSLWDALLQEWLQKLHQQHPEIALSAEADAPEILHQHLLDGALDIAFMFEPTYHSSLNVREIAVINLVMVANQPDVSVEQALNKGYLMVDWGTLFSISHAKYFPDINPPAIRLGMGRMAIDFLLKNTGAAYMADSMISGHIEDGSLFYVNEAPVIERRAYALFACDSDKQQIIENLLLLFPDLHSNKKS